MGDVTSVFDTLSCKAWATHVFNAMSCTSDCGWCRCECQTDEIPVEEEMDIEWSNPFLGHFSLTDK